MSSRSGELLDQGLDFSPPSSPGSAKATGSGQRRAPAGPRDLLGHLATSIRLAISTMQGQPPTRPEVARPGDLVDGDPAGLWRGIVAQAREVLRTADLALVMRLPRPHRGRRSGDPRDRSVRIRQRPTERTIHRLGRTAAAAVMAGRRASRPTSGVNETRRDN
jgi:hypothetical protein